MKIYSLLKCTFCLVVVFAVASCSENKPTFTVQGSISGADSAMLYIAKRSLSEVTVLDSVRLDKEGSFEFKEASPGYPEFYFLKLNGQTINLAVDSIETISVNETAPTFAPDYSVKGSDVSESLKEVVLAQYKLTLMLDSLEKTPGITPETYSAKANDAINEYKVVAKKVIYGDPRSLAAYFTLFQKVDNLLILDPYSKDDIRCFQAVATAWEQFIPQSPRSEHVKSFTLTAIVETRNAARQEETLAQMLDKGTAGKEFYDITLPNLKNEPVSLLSLEGKVVILDFTVYGAEYSPAHNIAINRVYERNKASLAVYQVSFDSDLHAWRNSAANLPWVCVHEQKGAASDLIGRFNLQTFPTTYILDRQGEIVQRIEAGQDIEAAVKKYL